MQHIVEELNDFVFQHHIQLHPVERRRQWLGRVAHHQRRQALYHDEINKVMVLEAVGGGGIHFNQRG